MSTGGSRGDAKNNDRHRMDVLAYVAAREGVAAIPGDDPSHDRPRRDDDTKETDEDTGEETGEEFVDLTMDDEDDDGGRREIVDLTTMDEDDEPPAPRDGTGRVDSINIDTRNYRHRT